VGTCDGETDPARALRPRVLWVSHEIPDPDLGGGSIRQYHLLRRLLEQADVDLVLAGHLRDPDLRAGLGRVVELPRPVAQTTWRRRLANLKALLPGSPPSEIAEIIPIVAAMRPHVGDGAGYDVVQLEHEHLAALLPATRTNTWAITLHNLVSVWSAQRAEVSTKRRVRWLFESDARRAARMERRIVETFDLAIAMSDADVARLGGGAVVVPNGVDLARFTASPLPAGPRLIFSGSFNWEPNIDGAAWLCEEVFPRVRQKIPDAILMLVGREPVERVRQLARLPGVEAHFDVDSVVPYLAAARVALVPLRMGSGTRLKALEAMAVGRPLAGTTTGLEGLDLTEGLSAAVADDPQALADAIVRLCRDDEYAARLAATGQALVNERYGWDAIATDYVHRILGGT
jgi:glycosyltransferase involved in cell wall biosynthesis